MDTDKIKEAIEEIDLCLELLGYEREALERMEETRTNRSNIICKCEKEDWRAWRMIYDKRKRERALKKMEDGYEEHLRYGVFPGNLEDGRE